MRATAISCHGVSKSFAIGDKGNVWRIAFGRMDGIPVFDALSDVSLEVPKGQFVGILGRNGAGKSTLLRTVGGIYTPDRGSISISGDLTGLYELGTVSHRELTGRKYAEHILEMHGVRREKRAAMIEDIHDFSELGERFDDWIHSYSAGMTARLFFAAATAGNYEVYLIDEILTVGDHHFQSKCWHRMRERIGNGASGLLVTHDWTAVIKLCSSAHLLDSGRVVLSGAPEFVVRRYLFGEAAANTYTAGVARFTNRPAAPLVARTGDDFHLRLEFEIQSQEEISALTWIEHLQPGSGWETILMTRTGVSVGNEPGHRTLDVTIPALPLSPGNFIFNAALVMKNPNDPQSNILLDGFGWLDGTGLSLEVVGEHNGSAIQFPASWSIETR